jgi:dihydroxyacid dehydratase/phosphogluconate dehydratase
MGPGDVNDFHHAGGMAFVTRTLHRCLVLLHDDILTAGADQFAAYAGLARARRRGTGVDEVDGNARSRHASAGQRSIPA